MESSYSGRPPGTNAKTSSSKPLDPLGPTPVTDSPGVIKVLTPNKKYLHHNLLVRNDEPSSSETDKEDDSDCMLSALNNILPESNIISGAKCNVCVHPNQNENKCIPGTALLDSGALQSNYIGRKYYESIKDQIPGSLKNVNYSVVLADGETRIPITEAVELYISLVSPDGNRTYYLKERFLIMDSHERLIIGLPTIVKKLLNLFIEMLNSVDIENEVSRPEQEPVNVIIKEPWSVIEEPAPEDEETPMPCSFPDALHYLSISHDEAVREYKEMLPSHVSPEFQNSTGIMDLLMSDLGINVFVPKEWNGVTGVPDIRIRFKEGMPARYKPPSRNVNPKLYENAKKEYLRLLTYFYERSDSPVASPLVVAFKATPPFLRFCGDYTYINKYIEAGHWPIPNVFQTLEKISKFKVFLDFDLTNGFHQFKLDPETARMLSIQTPWGQVQPKFLPEGVPIGSAWLQECMMDIFGEYEEFSIIIFDNLLVLAHDYNDAYDKVKLILARAWERKLVLKMKKSWLGFLKVNFFGYDCKFGSIELTEERKASVTSLPMPKNRTQMRRFLGCAGFFHKFVPLYAELTADLHEMNKDKFDWNKPGEWKKDYVAVFERFKEALLKSTTLYYPNYDLEWIVRADASDFGVGFVVLQVAIINGEEVHQPILFGSKKFSEQALKWSTYAKEAFAMYFAFHSCQYYLRAKRFTYEGDHANLQWMELCTDAKVIRWRIFMQNFTFWFNHIAGKKNMVADWQSRFNMILMEVDSETENEKCLNLLSSEKSIPESNLNVVTRTREYQPEPVVAPNEVTLSPDLEKVDLSKWDMFYKAHGGRVGHNGIRATKEKLNNLFPGHGISMDELNKMFDYCEVCQLNAKHRATKLVPITRHLKVLGPREVVGIDYLDICQDEFGNKGVYVLKDHFTLLAYIYPTATKDYSDCALAIFMFCVTYGKSNALISDPGSELRSEGVALLNEWFGIEHRFSLIDRHESNGVENTNKLVLKHLRNLAADEGVAAYALSVNKRCKRMLTGEKVRSRWSSPHIIGWVNFMLNKNSIHETGVSPFDLTFGGESRKYLDFPASCLDPKVAPKYLKVLNDDIAYLTDKCREFQANLIDKRTSKDLTQNLYQRGDLVWWELPEGSSKPSKLHGPYKGPYEVVDQYKNDVQVRHLATGKPRTLFVGELRVYYGDFDSAKAIAFVDSDQSVLEAIVAYKGDPLNRSTMQFLVLFADGDKEWLNFSKDLFDTQEFERYTRSVPELMPVHFEYKMALSWMKEVRSRPISEFSPDDVVYLDLRAFGAHWYQALKLPDIHVRTYIVECKFGQWKAPDSRKRILLACPLLQRTLWVDTLFVTLHCYRRSVPIADNVELLSEKTVDNYPELLTNRVLGVSDYIHLVGKRFLDEKIMYEIVKIDITKDMDICAFVRTIKSSGVNAKRSLIAYHVQSAEELVNSFAERGEKGGTATVGL